MFLKKIFKKDSENKVFYFYIYLRNTFFIRKIYIMPRDFELYRECISRCKIPIKHGGDRTNKCK